MKKILCFSALALISSPLLFAETLAAPQKVEIKSESNPALSVDIELSQAIRSDFHQFNMPGPHGKPSIVSEVTFKHVRSYPTKLTATLHWNRLYMRIGGDYASLCSGHVRDSDFVHSGRHGEYSRSISKVRGNNLFDGAFALGFDIVQNKIMTVTPLIGYQLNGERFRISDGYQTRDDKLYVKDFEVRSKTISCHQKLRHLNATHKTRWDCPLVGLRASINPFDKLTFLAEYDYLFALQYHAKEYWNLRDVHFRQTSKRSKGNGHLFEVAAAYNFANDMTFKVDFGRRLLHARKGTQNWGKFRSAKLFSSEIALSFIYKF